MLGDNIKKLREGYNLNKTELAKKLGIKHRKFHCLRHTYASTLLLNGADLKSVQELMGHYDIRITQVYLHTLPEKQKEVVSIWDK